MLNTNTLVKHASGLLAAYLQSFPEEFERTSELAAQLQAESGDIGLRSNMQGHITASALLLDEACESALLIHHRILDRWLQPGSHYEGEDLLVETALNELEEETGVMGAVPPAWLPDPYTPVDIDTHAIPANSKKDEGGHVHHDFMFVFIAPGDAELAPRLEEVHGAQWVPLSELPTKGIRMARLQGKVSKLLAEAKTSGLLRL